MKDSDMSFGLTEKELYDLICNNDELLIYDLRKKEEYAKGHIKKSILIQFDEKNLINASKSSKVVLVSKDEEQSKKVALSLRNQNIDAFYLIGGIKNWTRGLYCTNISYVGTGYP
ncbi:rhodanese-like domain-containing protein [Candidatus Nitrosarchaeum limnium]|jgi:rhodanese-related sulfurtransferase|uniref:Rhodanese-like protein n=1 Tax=Candidatus Nitrosarchaeum limnium BG20 TaxID=859192 RepID=S2E7G1_9ARCH|nr:rhodanese-like domain-containing protein [Candidatus Nitrosarchaeum limnium]EPA06673.1 rhodanese-like protein [Candidatus Nitrosarchaeum limnium BG20]